MKKLKFVYWNNIPTPYLINRLNKLTNSNNIEVEAWFTKKTKNTRSWIFDESKWKFKYKYLSFYDFIFLKVFKFDAMVTIYAPPINYITICLLSLFKKKVFIHYVKTFNSWTKRNYFKELLKELISNPKKLSR